MHPVLEFLAAPASPKGDSAATTAIARGAISSPHQWPPSPFNCFNARSENVSAFRHVFANHLLWAAVALSALLQVAAVHITSLNVAFGTVPLTIDQWLVCLAMGSSVLWFAELRKLLMRRFSSS